MRIRIYLVLRMGLARRGAGSLAFQSHLSHQTHHSLAVDRISLTLEPNRHPPAPIERRPDILTVYCFHQFFVGLTLPAGQQRTVIARTTQCQKLALASDAHLGIARINETAPFRFYYGRRRGKRSIRTSNAGSFGKSRRVYPRYVPAARRTSRAGRKRKTAAVAAASQP